MKYVTLGPEELRSDRFYIDGNRQELSWERQV
jgi:hypothetical protein